MTTEDIRKLDLANRFGLVDCYMEMNRIQEFTFLLSASWFAIVIVGNAHIHTYVLGFDLNELGSFGGKRRLLMSNPELEFRRNQSCVPVKALPPSRERLANSNNVSPYPDPSSLTRELFE
jgi:hypothetical protein